MVDSFAFVAIVEFSLIVLMFGYAGFWAFNIRHSLAVGLYRSQATGVGLIATVVGATVAVAASNGTGNPVVITPFALTVALAVFYFVDASTVAARRSDPLLRDTLRWSRVRNYLWPLVVGLAVFSLFANLALPSSVKYYTFEGILFSQSVYVVAIGSGVAALPLSALRSRDLTLRRHYRWFGMSLAFLLLFAIVVGPAPPIDILGGTGYTSSVIADFEVAFVSMFTAAYCLYRSSRSLVPLNRMSLTD
jgi:hypothetical protein